MIYHQWLIERWGSITMVGDPNFAHLSRAFAKTHIQQRIHVVRANVYLQSMILTIVGNVGTSVVSWSLVVTANVWTSLLVLLIAGSAATHALPLHHVNSECVATTKLSLPSLSDNFYKTQVHGPSAFLAPFTSIWISQTLGLCGYY